MGRIKSILILVSLFSLAACSDVGFDSLAGNQNTEINSNLSESEAFEFSQEERAEITVNQQQYNNFAGPTVNGRQGDMGGQQNVIEEENQEHIESGRELVQVDDRDLEMADEAEVMSRTTNPTTPPPPVDVDTVPHMISVNVVRECKASHKYPWGDIQRKSTVNRATHVTMRLTNGRFGEILCQTSVNYQQDIAGGGNLNVQIPACGKLPVGTQYEIVFHDENNTENVVLDPRQTSLGYVELILKEDGRFYPSSKLKILFGSNPHFLYKYGEANSLAQNLIPADHDLVEDCDKFYGPNPLEYDYN